ncbi:MAG: RluA family pseudouridine synthase [Candidatus Pacebacteria bacterium]|nr:RluA family pseudouridine synthase [Candidatus Paceibacterota bacterium]
MNTKIKIHSSQSTQRIDKFLASFYSEKSRASWQKRIKNKEVLVNKKIIKADYVLKEGDEVEILEISPAPFNKTSPSPSLLGGEIEIIYEDDDVIVINKPAGVLAQNAESSRSPSVSDFLVKHYPEIKNVGEDEMRFGVVHRLDKDTSGVMIVAKNNEAFEFLKEQFKNRKTQKTYLALVYGNVKPPKGEINFKIGRSKTRSNMQTVIDTKKKENIKSREALTIYKTIKSFENYTLLEVQPKTGRMHQIRVHLKAIGYPVVGDRKYFFRKHRSKDLELKRQFLHASELKIKLLDGKDKTFKAELASDLENFLDKLF